MHTSRSVEMHLRIPPHRVQRTASTTTVKVKEASGSLLLANRLLERILSRRSALVFNEGYFESSPDRSIQQNSRHSGP